MKRASNEGTIRQRPDGRWEARYIVSGKRKSLYASTQAEVKRRMRDILKSVDEGGYIEPSRMTVGAWLDRWFNEYCKTSVRDSTAATHFDSIRLHLKPALGSNLLQKLRPDHIQAFINQQARAGFKPATIRRELCPLKSALKQAVENQLIPRNPADSVKLPKHEQEEIEFLTLEEQQALIKSLPQTTQGLALRFVLGTGLRSAEVCGLRWCDIQVDRFTVNQVAYSVRDLDSGNYTQTINSPKTKASKRTIPLNPTLKRMLEERRTEQIKDKLKAGELWRGGSPGSGATYVFANAFGDVMDRNNLSRTLHSALRAAQLKQRGVHALRHTFATNWIREGANLRALSEILGHSSASFTLQCYVHADMGMKTDAMQAMGNLLEL